MEDCNGICRGEMILINVIKKDPRLAQMDLVRLGRLSVQTAKENEWKIVIEYAGEK